jgi:hypothetical protein
MVDMAIKMLTRISPNGIVPKTIARAQIALLPCTLEKSMIPKVIEVIDNIRTSNITIRFPALRISALPKKTIKSSTKEIMERINAVSGSLFFLLVMTLLFSLYSIFDPFF